MARPAPPHWDSAVSTEGTHLLVLPLYRWEKGSEAPAARPLGTEVERRRGTERTKEGAVNSPANP